MFRRLSLSSVLVIVPLVALLLAGTHDSLGANKNNTEKKDADRKKQPAHPAAAATYVGSAACSRCHLEIANKFARTSMGRSLTRITPEFLKTLPLDPQHGTSYFDQKSNHHLDVVARDGKLYQTEYESAAGQDVFRNTHEMEWIVGTGENGFGALLRRDGYLFQAPLSYYSRVAHWDLSPGYQNGNAAFNRAIQPGCIYCHSGRPQPVAGLPGKYESTVFTQTAVGCENCHGPGSAHIEAMESGEEFKPGQDRTIVNPVRLTEQLSDDICMGCHQTGDARVLQPGKTYQDFRPGEPLDKTFAIFQIPPTRENPPQDDHVEHYYSMTLSKCFRASAAQPAEKQMRCTTCHDPHVEPTGADAPAFYNSRCMSCHTQASCTATRAARQATTPADNCIGCHMPKRAIVVISHSTATNHRILAKPDEPYPDVAFAQTTAAMPDLIHLNAIGARGADAAPTPALIRLQAYRSLEVTKPASHDQFHGSWLKALSELEGDPINAPNSAIVQASLGHRALADHELPEAINHLQQSLKLDPLQSTVYVDLSEAQDQGGQVEDAIVSARKAVELDPFVPDLQKTLVFRLIEGKHYPEAQAALEHYVATFPEDDMMRKMLAMAKE